MTYRYCVFDDEHTINNKCFDDFASAFDYAQGGLITFIEEIPVIDGVECDDDAEIVWSWDDTHSKADAVKYINDRHCCDENCDEDLEISISADEPEEIAEFAKCVLGDNCEFFDQDFEAAEIPAVRTDSIEIQEPEEEQVKYTCRADDELDTADDELATAEIVADGESEQIKDELQEEIDDNAVKQCKKSKVIAHSADEQPVCDVKKPLDTPLTDDSKFIDDFYKDDLTDDEFLVEFGKAMLDRYNKKISKTRS